MKPTKKKLLQLDRAKVRELGQPELVQAKGGVMQPLNNSDACRTQH
jgi:hypothetical protein